MAAVADAFTRYSTVAEEKGVVVGDYLAAGLPESVVTERLIEIGVEPHESLVEWFGHINGVRSDSSGPALFNGRAVLSLSDAIADRQEGILPLDDGPPIYQPNWFPIIGDHPMLVVDTTTGEVLTVDLEDRTETTAGSLADWILGQIASIRALRDLIEFHHSYFEPGAAELHPSDRHFLSMFAVTVVERPLRFLRLTHAEPGSIEGNQGLERRQAELVVEHLLAEGAPLQGIVEYRIAPPPPEGHVVRMYGPPS